MITFKFYRDDEGNVYCDACSLLLVNTGIAQAPVTSGTPCTCDACGAKGRAA